MSTLPRPVLITEAKAIIDDFRRGVPKALIMTRYDRTSAVIDRVLAKAGISVSSTQKPLNLMPNTQSIPLNKRSIVTLQIQPSDNYTMDKRRSIINDAFEKTEELLDSVLTTKELREWVGAFTDLVEIRRLEDGDATERKEERDITGARERVLGRIHQLAERKRTAPDTQRTDGTRG
jgi:hypothetical protein